MIVLYYIICVGVLGILALILLLGHIVKNMDDDYRRMTDL